MITEIIFKVLQMRAETRPNTCRRQAHRIITVIIIFHCNPRQILYSLFTVCCIYIHVVVVVKLRGTRIHRRYRCHTEP